MNIFNKVTLQSMKKNRTRTFVTIIGVILSAAMITGVATFGISLLNYLAKGAEQKYGNWNAAFLDVDSSFIHQLDCDEEIKDTAAVENIGYAVLDGSRNPDKPYVFIAGFTDKDFDALPITMVTGRIPENSSEVIVSGSVAANGGVKFGVGDTISLDVGERMYGNEKLGQKDAYISGVNDNGKKETFVPREKKNYTVVGICQRPHFEQYSAPGYTLITNVSHKGNENNTDESYDTYKAESINLEESFSLFVTLKDPSKVHSYVKKAAGNYAYIFNDEVLRFMGLSDDNMFNGLLYSAGGIVVVIIMIGSIFLIYNSFSISLNERTRQFGILSSVGATAKQLQNSVLFEGICIGAIGIPIGIIAGLWCINLVLLVVSENFQNVMYSGVSLTLTLSIPAIVGAAVISMITILISAYVPARKAARIPVMESIRLTNEVKVEPEDMKTSKLMQDICGLEGTLALKNFKRNRKRYRCIVLSLVLSIVLFISVNSFVIYFKQISERTRVVTNYDIGVSVQDMDDKEMLQLYDKLKNANGVYESSYQSFMKCSCYVKSDNLSDYYWEKADSHTSDEKVSLPMELQFIDDTSYFNIIKDLNLPAEEYTGQDAKMIAVAKMEDNSNKVEAPDQLADMFTDSSMNFTIIPETNGEAKMKQGQDVSVKFVEIVPPDTLPILESSEHNPFCFRVMAPYSLKDKFETTDNTVETKGLTFRSENSVHSVAEMEALMQEEGITSKYKLYNINKMLDESRNYIFIANVFAYTFIIMISMIAAANVFNTISTNIKLRRRELAMLRSVGMSEHSFQKMMNLECIFYGMRALALGLPIALICSWLIYKGMVLGGIDDLYFVLPWSSIGISIFGVLFIVLITMLYSISKIKKENIIDALRDDMA